LHGIRTASRTGTEKRFYLKRIVALGASSFAVYIVAYDARLFQHTVLYGAGESEGKRLQFHSGHTADFYLYLFYRQSLMPAGMFFGERYDALRYG
jgi:hypothetical protein